MSKPNVTFRVDAEEARNIRAFLADMRQPPDVSGQPFAFFEENNRLCAIHRAHPIFEAVSDGTYAEFCDGTNTKMLESRWIGARPAKIDDALALMRRLGEAAATWRIENT
jgi:hypothetical protein